MKKYFLFSICSLILTSCYHRSEVYQDFTEENISKDEVINNLQNEQFCRRVIKAMAACRVGEKPVDGPQIDCKLMTVEEYGKPFPEDYTVYNLIVTGLCPGDKYICYMQTLDQKKKYLCDVIVSDKLQFIKINQETGDTSVNSNLFICLNKVMKAEPIQFIMYCKEKDSIAVTEIFDNPIEATWSDGATVKISAITVTMDMFFMIIQGLKPNEAIGFISESWDETLTSTNYADEKGEICQILSPMVIGHDGGLNKVYLKRLDSRETVTLEIPFGKLAFSKDKVADDSDK